MKNSGIRGFFFFRNGFFQNERETETEREERRRERKRRRDRRRDRRDLRTELEYARLARLRHTAQREGKREEEASDPTNHVCRRRDY